MFRTLIPFFFLLFAASTTNAITYITANIEADTRWLKANSPYIIVNDINIKPGATLSIEAGTKILFSAETKLIVEGTIRAIGSKKKKISFSGKDNSAWNGFELWRSCGQYDSTSNAGCVFQHCNFKGVGDAPAHLIRSKGCNLLLADCLIENCYTAVQSERQAHVYIENNSFKNCDRPLNVRNTSMATVRNNKMDICNSIMLGGSTTFTGNVLKNFSAKGRHSGVIIWMLGGGVVQMEKNQFLKFEDYAIKLQKMSRRSSFYLKGNTFKDNGTNLKISCKYANKGTTIVENNNFMNYVEHHVRLFAPCEDDAEGLILKIGKNFWGNLPEAQIKTAIFDKTKDDKLSTTIEIDAPLPKAIQ